IAGTRMARYGGRRVAHGFTSELRSDGRASPAWQAEACPTPAAQSPGNGQTPGDRRTQGGPRGDPGVPSISANLGPVTPPKTATGRYGGNRVSNILRPRCSKLALMGVPSGSACL